MLGYPSDAQHHTFLGHSRNLFDLALLGLVQVYFSDLGDINKWLRHELSLASFLLVFLLSGPSYSLISGISAIDEAVTEDSEFSGAFIVTVGALSSLVLTITGWHVVHARRTLKNPRDFKFYLGARAALYVAFIFAYFLIRAELNEGGPAKLHLHHYFVAWSLSFIAAFKSRISLLFLAITSGIFVQGISVYSSASMFYRGENDRPCPEIFIS